MQPFEQPFPAQDYGPAKEELQTDWLPNLAERLRTIERANLALERARVLLERVNDIETSRTDLSSPAATQPARDNRPTV